MLGVLSGLFYYCDSMLCLFKCIMFYGCIDMRIFHFGICTPDHVGGGLFWFGFVGGFWAKGRIWGLCSVFL